MCSRGGRAPKCSVTGCGKRSTKQCDFPLRGAKEGQTCSKHLCDAHAVRQGDVTRIDASSSLIRAVAKKNARLSAEIIGEAHYEDTVDLCPAHARISP